ncbi:MAG: hypothetical protein WA432_05015 [Candidatus Babeliaceae bacterium]
MKLLQNTLLILTLIGVTLGIKPIKAFSLDAISNTNIFTIGGAGALAIGGYILYRLCKNYNDEMKREQNLKALFPFIDAVLNPVNQPQVINQPTTVAINSTVFHTPAPVTNTQVINSAKTLLVELKGRYDGYFYSFKYIRIIKGKFLNIIGYIDELETSIAQNSDQNVRAVVEKIKKWYIQPK